MKTQAIYELIGHQAERAADSVALAAPGRSPLTYVELVSQIRGVGRALHGLGIGRNDSVIIGLPHGPEVVTACLGVAAYATAVPLDPLCSTQFVENAFASTDPKAVLVAGSLASAVRDTAYALGTAVIEVASDPTVAGRLYPVTATTNIGAVPLPAQADDDAFMLPTSDAGEDFAVIALTHHELDMSAREVVLERELTERDRCLNLTPLWKRHGSIGDVIATLVAGGTVVCPPNFDCAFEFFEWVRECRPTWYTAEPAAHAKILAMAGANRDVIKHSAIRFVQSSESELSRDLHAGLEGAFKAPVIERTIGA